MARVADLVEAAVDAHDGEAEELAVDPRQRRDVVGDGTFVVVLVAIVRLADEPGDELGIGQVAGRDDGVGLGLGDLQGLEHQAPRCGRAAMGPSHAGFSPRRRHQRNRPGNCHDFVMRPP